MVLAKKNLIVKLSLSLALVGLSGCGGRHEASVRGMVTLDGTPVRSGSVAFIPAEGGSPAYAQTDSSGRYEVFTGREAGLPPGNYGVTVVAREVPKETHSKDGGPGRPGKRITPMWYGSARTTPLEFTVEPGANKIDLELSSEPPPGLAGPGNSRQR